MSKISVLMVDDNPTFVRIATAFLQQADDIDMVSVAEGGEEAVQLASELQPTVILLDLALPDMFGIDAIPILTQVAPHSAIITLTLLDTPGYRQAALSAGAADFVSKTNLGSELLPAIRKVAASNQSH